MVANILHIFIVFFGYLLFIIPGIILSLTLSQAGLFALIDGSGPVRSLQLSRKATQGVKIKLLNLSFLTGIVYGLPIALIGMVLTAFKIPEFLVLNLILGVFGSCLYAITNYVIWKQLKNRMISTYNPSTI
jgi:hypothetical protein